MIQLSTSTDVYSKLENLLKIESPDACVWGKHGAWTSTVKWRRPPRTIPALTPGHNRAEARIHLPFLCGNENRLLRNHPKETKTKIPYQERRFLLGRSQTETITIRVTPEEKITMQGKMYEAVAPSMRDFILKMCMNGKVIVNSDL